MRRVREWRRCRRGLGSVRRAPSESAIDAEAARVTLVALAGMIPNYERVEAGRVRITPDAAVLTTEEAALLLASMPKPLLCQAESVAGMLEVKCELLAEADFDVQERFDRRRDLDDEGEDHFKFLVDRYGDDDRHLIGAFGRTEPVFVSLAGARRWFRDYEITFANCREDDANNEKAKEDPVYAEARKRGAKGILQFTSPAAQLATVDGHLYPFPLSDSAAPEDRRRVERTLIESARHLLIEMNDEEEMAAVERALVERGEIPADSSDHFTQNKDGFMHRVLASQMRVFFEGRELPPECAAFIDACRGR
jgi:preprotein translocase subunit Sec61beta